MNKTGLEKKFLAVFNKEAEHTFFCPGRVNLIGEHIDYNGGRVMPCAISLGTYLVIAKNTEKMFRFRSLDFTEATDIPLKPSYVKTGKEWYNYPLGVINSLIKDHDISGLDMLFFGDLPIGAGLSSSASIEVLTAFALQHMFPPAISKTGIALLSKKVENEFIGVNCGIMDQFAVAMGQQSKAILLNCDTLEYEYIPFNTGGYILTIINSNKQRSLADSKYNERFEQCRTALSLLNKELEAQHLCDIDLHNFESHRHLINDVILENRALHVISENFRVNEAADALKAGELFTFGKLMYASHQSLKDWYDVSGIELDTIVAFCKTYEGCIGARMTGAGFGGCAIALVKKEQFNDFANQLADFYKARIGYAPDVFASDIGDGVGRL